MPSCIVSAMLSLRRHTSFGTGRITAEVSQKTSNWQDVLLQIITICYRDPELKLGKWNCGAKLHKNEIWLRWQSSRLSGKLITAPGFNNTLPTVSVVVMRWQKKVFLLTYVCKGVVLSGCECNQLFKWFTQKCSPMWEWPISSLHEPNQAGVSSDATNFRHESWQPQPLHVNTMMSTIMSIRKWTPGF